MFKMTESAVHENALSEVRNVQQVPGEPKRRWFFSHEMDLIVWYDEEDRPISFQLAYDKHRTERVIRWKPERGYSHFRADDGTPGDDGRPASMFLMADGPFDSPRIRSRFLALSPALPWVVTQFVADRLCVYPRRQWKPGLAKTLTAAALVAIPLVIVACLVSARARRRGEDD